MVRLKVGVRLVFVKLPHIPGTRIFRDTMLFLDPDDKSYQDLSDLVERKLTFMELPPADFTVFFREPGGAEGGGDRVVVDTAYFYDLAHTWWRTAQAQAPAVPSAGGAEEEVPTAEVAVSFEVEVDRLLAPHQDAALRLSGVPPPAGAQALEVCGGAPACAPLTAANLKSHVVERPAAPPGVVSPAGDTTATGEVLTHVAQLTFPPRPPNFFLRCVVLSARFKTPKPGLSVVELELADAAFPTQIITAVTFDAVVQRAVKETLRFDGRHVVELRGAQVRQKTEADQRYATNSHPFLLRIDRCARLEVVQVRPVPVAGGAPSAVVTVRDTMRPCGVVELSDLVGVPVAALSDPSAAQATGLLLARSSSSSSLGGGGGPRRTTFSMASRSTATAPVSGIVPSALGRHLQERQTQYLKRKASGEELPFEPGLIPVTAESVRARERVVEQHASQELQRKERVRRRQEVCSACILCGLDCEAEAACMGVVRRLLEASHRNRGQHIPTFAELKEALSDRRGAAHRLVCRATFVNINTRTLHVVHCRCAHLCTSYQCGKDLEDITWSELPTQVCTLCGLPGAFVSCYHPDCSETYHVVCALFSHGYVNLGKKDPYLPCPACPRHTQVPLSQKSQQRDEVLHEDRSCWTDDIAFDSRVVTATDLRDPDENDGD